MSLFTWKIVRLKGAWHSKVDMHNNGAISEVLQHSFLFNLFGGEKLAIQERNDTNA